MAMLNAGAMDPVTAFALVGAIGVGSQWLAWRLRLPAIVLMLVAGIIVGPATGLFLPSRDIGPIMDSLISVAVAIILFEGGLTLNVAHLRDAAKGVWRLVAVGAPVGWLLSALALRYVAGLGWESAAVFGAIMIVTGPTVISPLLRQARLPHRPAALLQWEAIINDPIGALGAVLAFEVVLVLHQSTGPAQAVTEFLFGITFATVVGAVAGLGLSGAFRRGWVPEFMKVPMLFAILLAAFAIADLALHESGLLAVTIMGIVIANADLPSYEELRRFKEHATVLLVSGVFILLAASLDFAALGRLDWHAVAFVVVVILVVRPVTVMISLTRTALPMRERWLIALTGPRGVVLVAVAALFGERLSALGIPDGAAIGSLAFVLVATTVVLHGFTLLPVARALGLSSREFPGVLLIGGSRWSVGFAAALREVEVPVLIADPNHLRLRRARAATIPTFFGDILSEAADHNVELVNFGTVIAATDNDAYNTLVATDLAPEFGRENVFQTAREKEDKARHSLPTTLGGKRFGPAATYEVLDKMMTDGWTFKVSLLTPAFDFAKWRETWPDAILLARLSGAGHLSILSSDAEIKQAAGSQVVAMLPKGAANGGAKPSTAAVG
ncbi:MAG: cation:proton antiporter [Cypionkella sp.]